jgi:L-iditol 2-dehydrogenase
VVPDYSVVKLPDKLSFEEGALIEPIAVGMHAARLTKVQPGEKVLVIGAGPVGIGTCLSVKAMGASQIIAADIDDFNLEKAAVLGATETVNSAKEDLVEQVAKLTRSVGVDVAFIACGSSAVTEQALRCARFGGRVVQIGVIKSGEPFMYDILLQKELVYAASERYVKDDYDAVVQAINSNLITVKGMITDIYPIEEFQAVIEALDKRIKPYLKVLLKF